MDMLVIHLRAILFQLGKSLLGLDIVRVAHSRFPFAGVQTDTISEASFLGYERANPHDGACTIRCICTASCRLKDA